METFKRKIRGIIRLFRPELPFSAGICVLLGEIIALREFPSMREAIPGFLCGFFISGSALISNDFFDLEVDKINAPDRPLPSGVLSPLEAILIACAALVIGLAAASALNFHALLLSLFFGAVGILYNWRYKQAGLLGNLMVASSVAITFILGGLAVGRPFEVLVWFFGLTAFLIDLGEEIAGDAMDMDGDRKRNSKSIAIRQGKDTALCISGAIFILVVLISIIPYFLGWLGFAYLAIFFFVDVIIISATWRLLRSQTPPEGRRHMRMIYLAETFGMLAYIAALFFFKVV